MPEPSREEMQLIWLSYGPWIKTPPECLRLIPTVSRLTPSSKNSRMSSQRTCLAVPAECTVDHRIELEPGHVPPSRPTYRMSYQEELKSQVVDLLEKGFIRPSTSPFGAPVLLVKKRMVAYACVLTTAP